MKKDIFKSLFEIFIVTMLLTFSFPSWQKINASTSILDEKIERNTQRLEVYKLNELNTSVVYEESDFKPASIVVYNGSNNNRKGNLLLMYSKLSTLDYNCLNISINGISYDLKSLLLTSNKNYYVFILEEVLLNKYDSKEYIINFNLKDDVLADQISGNYFDSNIEISEY